MKLDKIYLLLCSCVSSVLLNLIAVACSNTKDSFYPANVPKISESTSTLQVAITPTISEQPRLPPSNPLYVAIECQKNNQCYAVSSDGFVFNTRDGRTWQYLTAPIPVKKDQELNLIDCPDPLICYVVGIENSGREPRYAIFFTTTDGGKTWSEFKLTDQSLGNFAFENMTCPSISTCYAVSSDGFVSTKNSGKSWQKITLKLGGYYKGISCPTEKKCVLVSGLWGPEEARGSIYTTEDGWDSAQNRTLNLQQPLSNVSCLSALNCMILGPFDIALTTNDGGQSWKDLSLPKTTSLGLVLNCYSPQNCYTLFFTTSNSPESYTIYNTSDGGKNWNAQKADLEKILITTISCTPSGLCLGSDRNGYPKIASNVEGSKWSLQSVNWK